MLNRILVISISGKVKGGNLILGIGDRSDGVNEDTIQGFIDEARIYEKALSEADVKTNFTGSGLAVDNNCMLSLTWGKIKLMRDRRL